MKEIGKLLELLNEYSKEIGYFNEEDLQGQTKAWILSKEFGWIEWLVENDKIDRDKTMNNHLDFEFFQQDYGIDGYWYRCVGFYESLLCLLSISDTPIEDLISYLK